MYQEQLSKAVEYASRTGSFSKYNVCNNAKNVCVFGLGTFFNEAFQQFNMKERYHVNILCDNDKSKWGRPYYGLPCVSPQELKYYENLVVIPMIGEEINLKSIEAQLQTMDISFLKLGDLFFEQIAEMSNDVNWFRKNQRILETLEILSDDESKRIYTNIVCNRIAPHLAKFSYWDLFSDGEYFSTGLYSLNESESFVDCGAYTGDTIERFIDHTNNKFSNIYAFELDKSNFEKLKTNVKVYNSDKIHLYNMGVWNENCETEYGKEERGSGESFSILKKENPIQAKVVKLDDILADKKITLIKMDIEGSEMNALKGCENIIKEQKPKLAICLYHKLEDFWTIALYLKSIVGEYKFSIRHHQYGTIGGTVLYAYIE